MLNYLLILLKCDVYSHPCPLSTFSGTLTLRVRQLQAVEIYLLGAYGLCPRDANGKSDPFVEITCHSGGVMGGVAGEGEGDAELQAEEEAAAMAAGNPELIVTEVGVTSYLIE